MTDRDYLWDVIDEYELFNVRILGHERRAVLRSLGVAQDQWQTVTDGPQIRITRDEGVGTPTMLYLRNTDSDDLKPGGTD